ncbi:hypothetical protein PsYK624_074490 [Phanerochaete sordida]|uniref:Uncharacterized protein n=1 Tax=Phanerochaete sordida TaxID=48140 RepID=A0A9P3LDI6_9APHY|nr:hypothetical protein PsYK624_074490 [Phanerochaete sordida]
MSFYALRRHRSLTGARASTRQVDRDSGSVCREQRGSACRVPRTAALRNSLFGVESQWHCAMVAAARSCRPRRVQNAHRSTARGPTRCGAKTDCEQRNLIPGLTTDTIVGRYSIRRSRGVAGDEDADNA